MSSANPSSTPPPPNPVLSAYEDFVLRTPLVTRYILSTQFTTWFLSFFVDLFYATANIPQFTVLQFEIYRILVSPFVCTSFLSLIFAFLGFADNGRRLELSLGSTAFGWLVLTMGSLSNVIFLLVCFTFYALTGSSGFLVLPSSGIWVVLLAIIAIECTKAPRDSQRRLFVIDIPVIYYPLTLLALFSLLGGFSFSHWISVGVGYAYGYGYLDKLKIGHARCKKWEDTILQNFVRREGWVAGHAATGSNAWSDANNASTGGFSMFQRRPEVSEGDSRNASNTQNPNPSTVDPSNQARFPTGGRALGGGGARRHVDTQEERAARLSALERKRADEDSNV